MNLLRSAKASFLLLSRISGLILLLGLNVSCTGGQAQTVSSPSALPNTPYPVATVDRPTQEPATPQNRFLQVVGKPLDELPVDPIERRLLQEYGSLWVNPRSDIHLPRKLVFANAQEHRQFKETLDLGTFVSGGCSLQRPAVQALERARAEAKAAGLTLSPRGSDGCLRSYETTESLWLSRVEPNLQYYQSQGKLSAAEAQKVREANLWQQVELVLALEDQRGLLFDKYRQTSILNSVAIPGTSQHLSGLAFDLAEYADARVRQIMNKHGWFQTIQNDVPHFTYLGISEPEELRARGLRPLSVGQYTYWVPELDWK